MRLDVSLNEVETLAAKAARGWGLSWGMADEVGRAARWLARLDLPWAESLAALAALPPDALAAPSSEGPGASGATLSPIACGCALADGLLDLSKPVAIGLVAHPLWLLPFAARRVRAVGALRLRWPGISALVDGSVWLLEGGRAALGVPGPVDVFVEPGGFPDASAERLTPAARGQVDAPAWDALDRVAARTYVPASEASRTLGAGAGLNDND